MKSAIVTGAGSGMGKAISLMLAKNGYHVHLCGRTLDRLETVQSMIKESGQESTICQLDIGNEELVRAKLSQRADVVVHVAGINHSGEFLEVTPEKQTEMINTHLKGYLNLLNTQLPLMKEKKSGHVISITSLGYKKLSPFITVYNATKEAEKVITESLIKEYAEHGVRFCTVAPGKTYTHLLDNQNINEDWKLLNTDEIADAVEFVVTRAPHINITNLEIRPTDRP